MTFLDGLVVAMVIVAGIAVIVWAFDKWVLTWILDTMDDLPEWLGVIIILFLIAFGLTCVWWFGR